MNQSLANTFTEDDFNSDKFVKDLSSLCIGVEELKQQRAKIQEISNSTSALLKHNVYQNYIQFIETAKEISHLESEMCQLSQFLSEQRSLLSLLAINQNPGLILEEEQIKYENLLTLQSKDEEAKQLLKQLLENVEGAASLLDNPGRICLFEGSLLELDPLDGTPIKRIHAFLFNDVLMIASWLSNSRRGSPRYRMQVVYDIKSLAVVNVKDLGSVTLAIKLLAFPDTRVFQCPTATNKKEWLDKCDQAKKTRNPQRSPMLINKNLDLTENKQITSFSRRVSLESNIFCMENNVEFYDLLPDWVIEATEDLDSYIAQRYFEDAYNLFSKAKSYISDCHLNFSVKEIKEALNDRSNKLINVIENELESSAEAKSLQGGGLRSAKRAVKLLILLDRTAKACQLYLRLCSLALKASVKRVKREGATIAYVKQIGAIAFSSLAEIAQEFLKTFPCTTSCSSALIVWCSSEIRLLASHLIKQLFVPQVSLSTLAECNMLIRNYCVQLNELGMDFHFQWDGYTRSSLSKVLQDTGEKYMDAVKIRATEDSWKSTSFPNIQTFKKVFSELDYLGIPLPDVYIRSEDCINLTNNTLTFSKLYIGLLEDCLNIATHELIPIIEEVLLLVMQVQVQHFQLSLQLSKFDEENQLIQNNAKYVHDVVMTRSLDLHKIVTGYQFTKLLHLQEKLRLEICAKRRKSESVSQTSIPKYSTYEYI